MQKYKRSPGKKMSSIITQIKNGDEQAFEQIYKEYYARLFHYLKGYLKESEEIKDVIQNTFIALWNNKSSLTEDTRIYSWLFTVVRNQCLNYIRDKETRIKFQSAIELHESEKLRWQSHTLHSSIPESITLSEITKLIDDAVREMPDGCRKVFVLSRYDGLSNKEIGLQLNISPKTVENQITKALKILRSKFNDYHYFLLCLVFF